MEGTGKSALVLSAAKLGPMAIVDTEFGMHNYLVPLEGVAKRFTLIEPMKKLLGIPVEQSPSIAWLQSNDLTQVRAFLEAATKDESVVTIGMDSVSILWDIASSTVDGRQDWNKAKQPLRMMQYLILASKKNYIFTAHLNKQFNEDMTKVVGEFPWSEKKDPHWGDLNLKMIFPAGDPAPSGIVLKERSAGRVKKGEIIRGVTLEKIFKLFGQQASIVGTPLDPVEAAYRADAAGRKSQGGAA
jgi:hypothetical protein